VRLAIDLIRDAGVSLRGVAASLSVFMSRLGLDFPVPSFSAIRSWLLRLGCYALTRPLPRDTPWAWLIDHSVQIGTQKLLVIAGCPLAQAPFGERALCVSDLSLIGLVPMEQSNGPLVAEELKRVVARTGVPRQIVSDGGGDLNNGVAIFQEQHAETAHVRDAAHYAANVLKNRWEKDERWQAFVQQLPRNNAKMRQTKEAYLLPPALRSKARFMNVGPVLRFAERVLRLLDRPTPAAKVEEKYGWLRAFRDALAGWRCEYEIVQSAVRHVRKHGVSQESPALLEGEWSKLEYTPGANDVKARIRTYVREAAKEAKPGERLLASTEVLESAFGKLKHLEGSQAGSGFTGLTLSLGAMMSAGNEEEIRAALDEVPKKEAEGWAKRMFGTTIQWLRRRFLAGEMPEPA